jgi:hypothetical protein
MLLPHIPPYRKNFLTLHNPPYWENFLILKPMNRSVTITLAAVLVLSCQNASHNNAPTALAVESRPPIKILSYTTLGEFPHDTTSFTEGLLVHDNQLYESTGYLSELPQTRSWFGTVDRVTGKINPRVQLDTSRYFGEGICFLGNRVYQLTYRKKVGFVYDAKTFKRLGDFVIPGTRPRLKQKRPSGSARTTFPYTSSMSWNISGDTSTQMSTRQIISLR